MLLGADKIKIVLRNTRDRMSLRRKDILDHKIGLRAPRVKSLIVPDLKPTSDDIKSAERLLNAYHRGKEDDPARQTAAREDMWQHIKSVQADFVEILDRNDPVELASYLCNMNRQSATFGVAQGKPNYEKIRSSPSHRKFVSLMDKDKLVSLAEAVGAIPCENPEQGVWGTNLYLDVDSLADQIESKIGIDITPPNIDGGTLKVCTSRGLFFHRDLNAIYTAWCLKEVLPKTSTSSICEIGAGSGRVAHWSWRFGFRNYTIFDLPHINVVQGFYLMKSLPNAPITLYGETDSKTQQNGITILPYWKIHDQSPRKFDLILNQDSFPEIHADTVQEYLETIKVLSRQYFLSINHESCPPAPGNAVQLNVSELIEKVGGYRRLSRTRYWLRRGYVSELYAVNETDAQ